MMSEDTDGDVQTQRTQIEKAMRWDPVDNFDPYGTETTYYLSWHFTISPCFDCPEPCYLIRAQELDEECRLSYELGQAAQFIQHWCPRATAGELLSTFLYTSLDEEDVFYKGHFSCAASRALLLGLPPDPDNDEAHGIRVSHGRFPSQDIRDAITLFLTTTLPEIMEVERDGHGYGGPGYSFRVVVKKPAATALFGRGLPLDSRYKPRRSFALIGRFAVARKSRDAPLYTNFKITTALELTEINKAVPRFQITVCPTLGLTPLRVVNGKGGGYGNEGVGHWSHAPDPPVHQLANFVVEVDSDNIITATAFRPHDSAFDNTHHDGTSTWDKFVWLMHMLTPKDAPDNTYVDSAYASVEGLWNDYLLGKNIDDVRGLSLSDNWYGQFEAIPQRHALLIPGRRDHKTPFVDRVAARMSCAFVDHTIARTS